MYVYVFAGMVEAADINCPTCFIILPEKRTFAEDSAECPDKTPGDLEQFADAVHAPEEVKSWLRAFCAVSSKVNEIADKVKSTAKGVQSAVDTGTKILAGDTKALTDCISKNLSAYMNDQSQSLWLYLVDEATGEVVEPPENSVYPIKITTPRKTLPVLLPLAKIGLKAMCITNNVAKLGRAFGYPLPALGQEFVDMAEKAIGDLSKESSVAEYDVLQNHLNNVTQTEQGNANTGKQDPETIRGAALREFQRWLVEKDPQYTFCNLDRVLTSEGKSCWTTNESANNMREGKEVLNESEVQREDPKIIDDKIKLIQQEKEIIDLKRRLKELCGAQDPAEEISTSPRTSNKETSLADEGKSHSPNDTESIDEKCM
jgi:uncharacterized FlaG/YvyC family protein